MRNVEMTAKFGLSLEVFSRTKALQDLLRSSPPLKSYNKK